MKSIKELKEELVGKNTHSVYVRCNECQKFGINMPLDNVCGNCNSKDTVTYYDIETIHYNKTNG